jgi:hypothetical protein
MKWSPVTPDLNSIKHVLDKVEQSKHETELKGVLLWVWQGLSADVMRKLFGSLSKRFNDVIRINSYRSRY